MKIGILDDERSMLLRIRGYVEEARIKEPYTVELFQDVEEFFNCGKNFDILLLDIDANNEWNTGSKKIIETKYDHNIYN